MARYLNIHNIHIDKCRIDLKRLVTLEAIANKEVSMNKLKSIVIANQDKVALVLGLIALSMLGSILAFRGFLGQ